jgi:methionine-rich copper-binding protein CopC
MRHIRNLDASTKSVPRRVGKGAHWRTVPTPPQRWARFALPTLQSLPLLLSLSVGAAHAHAFLDHAEPRVGNTVKSPPRTVALWFTQNLESAFSTVEVLDANGARMNAGNAAVDAGDRKLLRVPVKALSAGTYTVKWHVLSVDTHTTEGNFTFHIAP